MNTLQKAFLGALLLVVCFMVFKPVFESVASTFTTLAEAFPQTYAQRSH